MTENTIVNKLEQLAGMSSTTPVGNVKPLPQETKEYKNKENKELRSLILSIVQSFQVIKEEQDSQKEILKKIKDEYGKKPRVVKKTAKLIYDRNKNEFDEIQNEIDDLYDIIEK